MLNALVRVSRSCWCLRGTAVLVILCSLSWLSLESFRTYSIEQRHHQGSITTKKKLSSITTKTSFNQSTTISKTTPNPHEAIIKASTDDDFDEVAVTSPPLQVWHDYVAVHGKTALQHDTDETRSMRKFIIAPYWCPDRIGNVFHNLWNTVTWGILLNRTVLFRWVHDNPNGNTREACQAVLPMHAEMPLFEEWHKLLDIDTTDDAGDIRSIPLDPRRYHFDESLTTIMVPQINDVYHQVGNKIYRNTWSQHPLSPGQSMYREYLQQHLLQGQRKSITNNKVKEGDGESDDIFLERQTTAVRLFSWGIPFLYGMYFRNVFIMPDNVPTSVSTAAATTTTTEKEEDQEAESSSSLTVALHSRHVAHSDDGSLVPEETQCLSDLLFSKSNDSSNKETCTVYLLSDRKLTILALTKWLHNHAPHCRVLTTLRDDDDENTRVREHGPWAGAGFIHDLAMATRNGPVIHDALVGDLHRSSFSLLYELAVYDKFMVDEQEGQPHHSLDLSNVELPVCSLSERTPKGYKHGPDSPLFVRNKEQFPPLEPMKVLDNYRQTVVSDPHRFVVTDLRCPLDDNYAHFLTAVIFAILSDRLVFWTNDKKRSCRVKGWLSPWNEHVSKKHKLNLSQAVDINDENSHASASDFVKLSEKTLDMMVTVFSEENFLKPKQGGARRVVAEALYTYGIDFLFGMLLNEIYEIPSTMTRDKPIMNTPAWTVGLDMGEKATFENVETCLDKSFVNRTSGYCQLVLLGGKEQTSKDEVKRKIRNQYNCSIIETENMSAEEIFALTGQIRNAWIAPIEPDDAASFRIRERIEWKRVHASWSLGKFPIVVPPFVDCAFE